MNNLRLYASMRGNFVNYITGSDYMFLCISGFSCLCIYVSVGYERENNH